MSNLWEGVPATTANITIFPTETAGCEVDAPNVSWLHCESCNEEILDEAAENGEYPCDTWHNGAAASANHRRFGGSRSGSARRSRKYGREKNVPWLEIRLTFPNLKTFRSVSETCDRGTAQTFFCSSRITLKKE